MVLFRQHLKYTYVKTKIQKNKTNVPSKPITKLFLKKISSLIKVIKVASFSLVISVDVIWESNRFETGLVVIKLVGLFFLEPVDYMYIHLDFIAKKLNSYGIVLYC